MHTPHRIAATALAVGLAALTFLSPAAATAGSTIFPTLPATGIVPLDDALIGAGSVAPRPGNYSQAKTLPDGVRMEVRMSDLTITKVPPQDGSPFSGEFYLDGDFYSGITGPDGTPITSAVLETGYIIGYPLVLYPEGFKMDLKTPELSVGGGIAVKPSAGVGVETGVSGAISTNPGVTLNFAVKPSIGVETEISAKADATILPSQSIPVDFRPGGTTQVPISVIQHTGPLAFGAYKGVRLSVSSVLGPITVKPYITLHVVTQTGEGIITAYGNIVTG